MSSLSSCVALLRRSVFPANRLVKQESRSVSTLISASTASHRFTLWKGMYKELTEIPIPSSAHFTKSDTIQVLSTWHDHIRNVKRSATKSIILTDDSATATPLQDVGDVVNSVISPSRARRAVLREIKMQPDSKRFVEIWDEERLEASMEVTETHGAFYTDEYIRSLAFSSSETSLIYTAEANAPTSSNDDPYHKFRFTPQFGEGLVGRKRPTIFIFRWATDKSQAHKLISLSVPSSPALFGQAIFSPDSHKLYATGYEYTSDGRQLGVKGCYNRPSGIWELTPSKTRAGDVQTNELSCTARKLTPSHLSCRSPRVFSHEGTSILFWLACPTGGAHVSTSLLYSLDITGNLPLPSSVINLGPPLVDAVFGPLEDEFPGLYPDYNLPAIPFVHPHTETFSGPCIVTHSLWGSRSTVLLVSTAKGEVKDLTPEDGDLSSWTVFTTDGESRILCARSTPVSPPQLMLGEFDDTGVSWRVIDKPNLSPDVQSALATLSASVMSIPERHPTQAIVLRSQIQPKAKDPCITYPHGGPHATTTTAFSAAGAASVLEGYTIAYVNYTGSLGFGESSVRALLGHCGTLDVQDCIATTRHLVKEGITADGPGKQFVFGGSHGGFLAAHLLGQFPDTYTAAVIRNPVISAGEMSSTDIPDWYYFEFGLDYPLSSSSTSPEKVKKEALFPPALPPLMSPEMFERVYKASPIAYVDKVRASVLLLIGASDLRVAPTQGIEYYHALKGRRQAKDTKSKSGEVEMLIFEGESHPLDGVEAARVGWEAARDFIADARKRA